MSLQITSSCPGGIHAPARAPVFVPRPVKLDLPVTGFHLLTPRECESIELLVVHGARKLVARAMGISVKTVDANLMAARAKTGYCNSIQLAIAYERWARGTHEKGE